jgi:type VI secretion system protein ImpM
MQIGLYGKLPSHGDFLRRRTSEAFVTAWDAWLQASLAASRSALGDRWLDVYLTSPAWRFAAAAGSCGPAPVLGVMVPSVDRVGRCFPLALVAELPVHVHLVHAALAAAPFFETAERLAIDTLAADYVDFEEFDAGVVRLADDLARTLVPPRLVFDAEAAAILDSDPGTAWQFPLVSVDELRPALEQLAAERLSAAYDPLMLWWTEGSSIVEPGCLVGRGLPRPESFVALLEGAWELHGWRTAGATIADRRPGEALLEEPALSFRSAGASDVGRVRSVNQDAFLERPEVGVWTVADGLGGHSDGELASRMVCDALADFQPEPSFEDTIEAVRVRLQDVNDHLLFGTSRLPGDRSGSTVVALLVRGRRGAILWAGDSRLYRWRTGRLEQLTRDHSPPDAGSTGRHTSNSVTRAVGAQSALELDLRRDLVLAGDRYLLCSDGLTRVVPEARIAEWMQTADLRAVVDGLVGETLAGGAPDNVTALVVEASY